MRRRCLLAVAASHVVQLAAYAAVLYHQTFESETRPYHTSALTGEMWIQELIHGHPDRIHCELGVRLHIFNILVTELLHMGYRASTYVSLEEQLGIFLHSCVTGLSIRHVAKRFQRSNETITKYVYSDSQLLDLYK